MISILGFDIETAKIIEDVAELDGDDLGITCAATFQLSEIDGTEYAGSVRWHGQFDKGAYAERMTPTDVGRLVRYLIWRHYSGPCTVATWNGLAFDFRVLNDEIDSLALSYLCKALALDHIDPAFQMCCEKGFMCGLSSAAKGFGLGDKVAGMSGAEAPKMWQQTFVDQEKVLDYVVQDAFLTAQVVRALTTTTNGLYWITKAGTKARFPWWPSYWLHQEQRIVRPDVPRFKVVPTNRAYLHMIEHDQPRRLLTVTECLSLPLPDTSWMDEEPPSRESHLQWLYPKADLTSA